MFLDGCALPCSPLTSLKQQACRGMCLGADGGRSTANVTREARKAYDDEAGRGMRRWSRTRAGEGPAAGTGALVRRCRSLGHAAGAAHGDAGGATGRGRAEACRGYAPTYEVRQAGALISDTVKP